MKSSSVIVLRYLPRLDIMLLQYLKILCFVVESFVDLLKMIIFCTPFWLYGNLYYNELKHLMCCSIFFRSIATMAYYTDCNWDNEFVDSFGARVICLLSYKGYLKRNVSEILQQNLENLIRGKKYMKIRKMPKKLSGQCPKAT